MTRISRSSWLLSASAATIATVLLVFVFPTSSLLAQRRDRAQVESQLRGVTNENRLFEARIRQLLTRAEIERLARSKYNLVHDGEQAFAILPPRAAAPVPKRGGARPSAPAGEQTLWARVWSRASALF
jgi:cell division protein FtsB